MKGHWLALAIIAGFCVLATLYSLVTPPFETPDEVYHYAFARHVAQGNGLPVQTAAGSGPWEQEGSQAPLYYLAVGLLTAGIDQEDFPALAARNPRANIGDPLYPGNKNFMLYSGAAHPLHGANLALHVGRWLSVLLGALTLWFTYLTARRVFPGDERSALLCLLLPAAIPQFAFLSGAMTNDSMIVATSAAAIWWLARMVGRERGETGEKAEEAEIRNWRLEIGEPRAWEWAVLGGMIGLAALSKLQGIGLLAVAGAAALGLGWLRRDWRLPLRAALPLLIPVAAIAGWWYWRNVQLYGDWTGLAHLLEINGRRAGDLSLADWWLEFRGLRYSFWGLFGWFNILLPQWVYWVLDGATVLAAVGLIGALAQRWRAHRLGAANRVLALALLWSALSCALLVYWTLRATGSQGRLLFPAIGTLAILFVLGLEWWLRAVTLRHLRTGVWAALIGLLVGSSVYALAWLLPRSYRPDAPVAGVVAGAQETNITFEGAQGELLELVAVDIPEARFRPGEDAPVTLYLRAPAPVATDYELFVQLLDERGAEIANVTSHPGWGRNPTTLWEAGALYADRYLVRITGPVGEHAPLLARVYTGFIDPATSNRGNFPLTARDAAGEEVTPFVGQVAVSPHAGPDAAGLETVGSTFGDVITVVGARVEPETVQAGGTLTATLLYEAQGAPATDYTAFVHLRDASGATVAGFDQRPAGERFPSAAWRAGDRIEAAFPLALPDGLPPGEYTLWTGLYETASGGALRLPVTGGAAAGDGEVEIARVEVSK
jgi:4-amino-4-deoxy-L-arabinose transferase-like glycosyltransferase